MAQAEKTILRKLYEQYNLTMNEMFQSPQGWTIITRAGIDKIQSLAKININYDVVHITPYKAAYIKATGTKGDVTVQTFGEATLGDRAAGGNTKSNYVMAIAEKRAMSRVVLKLTGFYAEGAMGEDEAEDFSKVPKKDRKPISELITDTL